MKFVKISELKIRKFQSLIDDVSDASNEILREIEDEAIEYVKTFLNGRYDTDYIFSRTGTKRNALVRGLVIDYMMCQLWMRTNSIEIPQSMQDKCEKNAEFLMNISTGKISPDLPTLDPELQGSILFSSNSEPVFNDTDHTS